MTPVVSNEQPRDNHGVRYTYIQHGGAPFDLRQPKAEDIDIDKMCYALSGINRFTGHGDPQVNVANHLIRVANIVCKHEDAKVSTVKTALIHDMHEAFINDTASPMKNVYRLLAGFDIVEAVEAPVDLAIQERLGFTPQPEDRALVKKADTVALMVEVEQFLEASPHVDWQLPDYRKEFPAYHRAGFWPDPSTDESMLRRMVRDYFDA